MSGDRHLHVIHSADDPDPTPAHGIERPPAPVSPAKEEPLVTLGWDEVSSLAHDLRRWATVIARGAAPKRSATADRMVGWAETLEAALPGDAGA